MDEFYLNLYLNKAVANGNHRNKALPLWLCGAPWPPGTLPWAGGTVVGKLLIQSMGWGRDSILIASIVFSFTLRHSWVFKLHLSKYLVHMLKVARSTHFRGKKITSPLCYFLKETVQSSLMKSWNLNCTPYFISHTLKSTYFLFFCFKHFYIG